MITLNAARCTKCGDVIKSTYRHDFVECTCGNVFVDGGFDYIRHGVIDADYYENLSTGTSD